MDKYAVAQILREIGLAIEFLDANPKKGIAYNRAARAIEAVDDFNKILREKSLESIPGIGSTLSRMIENLVKRGNLPYHQELIRKIPEGLFELFLIPGLGIKRIRLLYETFHITNLSELKTLFEGETIRTLKGFGPAYTQRILKNMAKFSLAGASLLYPQALNLAEAFVEILKPSTERLEITGELRRKLEVVSQIDLLVVTNHPEETKEVFISHPLVKQVNVNQNTTIGVLLKNGLKAYLYFCPSHEFFFFLLNTTGNRAHLEELNMLAIEKGVELHYGKSEKDIYRHVGLSFIHPELREGYGEIEKAKETTFHLIQDKDLHGVFHCHTVDSDGIHTIEEMAVAAKKIGWEYIGITDHSKSSYQANGMSEERLFNQVEHIKTLNRTLNDASYIFSGLECDILPNGDLDFPNDVLKELDFVIASVHSLFKLEKNAMTNRLIRAIENPYTLIIGHLTGRLLRHRDPYQLDIEKVIDACVANHKVIELNAFPSRLDMDWRLWIQAKNKGLKCCISPDAHSIGGLMAYQYGINIARKGWLEKSDVINTLTLKEMKSYLK